MRSGGSSGAIYAAECQRHSVHCPPPACAIAPGLFSLCDQRTRSNFQRTSMEESNMSRIARAWIVVLLTVVAAMAGCSRSPEAKKARHLDRGDRYFAREQYREAVIEYQNALRIEPANARAIWQLAFSHAQLGEPGQAFRYLAKSRELEAGNLDVRRKLG